MHMCMYVCYICIPKAVLCSVAFINAHAVVRKPERSLQQRVEQLWLERRMQWEGRGERARGACQELSLVLPMLTLILHGKKDKVACVSYGGSLSRPVLGNVVTVGWWR